MLNNNSGTGLESPSDNSIPHDTAFNLIVGGIALSGILLLWI